MTTTTWAAPTVTVKVPNVDTGLIEGLKKVRHFLAVCIGVYAEQDSNYRGLDLYGNPIWVKLPKP